MNNTKLTNLLSIACRAGKVISGEFVIEKALAGRNRIKLIILANDISQATKEKYENLCAHHQINYIYSDLTKDELASAIGKTDRAAVAVCDMGFSKAIIKLTGDNK